MSLFRKRDYVIDTKRVVGKIDNRNVMKKVKIPTKTKYSVCPRCSKKSYVQRKGFCKFCHFKFTPNKKLSWQNGKQMHK